MVARTDPTYDLTDPRHWFVQPDQYRDFAESRNQAAETLSGLDADDRRGIYETEVVYNYGWGVLQDMSPDQSNPRSESAASMLGAQAALRDAMRKDPSAPRPGDPFRRYDDLPKPGHPRDIGPGTTWWQQERSSAYRSGWKSMLEDVAKLNQPELRILLRDLDRDRGPSGLRNSADRLRDQFASAPPKPWSDMDNMWSEGRTDSLSHWRTEYLSDQLAASAALDGQLAPGSPAPSAGHGTGPASGPASGTGSAAETGAAADARPPRTAPTAANAAGHRYPSAGTSHDQRGR